MSKESFVRPLQLRWSDLDPNAHLRHSVYYDFGAQIRIEFFDQQGLSPKVMEDLQIGPILFREEAVFRKEIRFGDVLSMNMEMLKLTRNASRFTITHKILREDVTCATVSIDGAWLDRVARKLNRQPPEIVFKTLDAIPKATEFEWMD